MIPSFIPLGVTYPLGIFMSRFKCLNFFNSATIFVQSSVLLTTDASKSVHWHSRGLNTHPYYIPQKPNVFFTCFYARQVRRGDVLQGAQHHDRPARVHGRAHRAAPLHGHHGRDAQLAHGQALQQRLQDGRVHHQGAHQGRPHGHADRQRGARDGERGQPHQRVLARRRLCRLHRHHRRRQVRQVLRVQGDFWQHSNPITPHA